MEPDRSILVLRSSNEAQTAFDYVVCTSKAINQAEIPAQIARCVAPERTAIVLIQNGIGNEEPFRDYFPTSTIISCVVRMETAFISRFLIKSNNLQLARRGLVPLSWHQESSDTVHPKTCRWASFPILVARLQLTRAGSVAFQSSLQEVGQRFKLSPIYRHCAGKKSYGTQPGTASQHSRFPPLISG